MYNVPSAHVRSSGSGVKGSYFHPRAYEACQPEPLADDAVPDLSFSESSDDSDGCQSPQSPLSPNMSGSGSMPEELHHVLLPYGRAKPRGGNCHSQHRTKKPCLKRAKRTSDSFREPGLDGCLGGF
jgi:hypothetical protein